MVDSGGVVFESRPRRRHALSEKWRIVELTFQPGASVALVARANGVNAILPPRDYDEWLDRAEIERPLVHLLRPYSEPGFQIHVANPKVGNVRNQDIDLLGSQ